MFNMFDTSGGKDTGMAMMLKSILPDILVKMGVNGAELNALVDWAKQKAPEFMGTLDSRIASIEKQTAENNIILRDLYLIEKGHVWSACNEPLEFSETELEGEQNAGNSDNGIRPGINA